MASMATALTPARRSALRAEAHKLRPTVLIGDKGLTDEVLAEVDRALKAHELIKVRAATDDRDARNAWMEIDLRAARRASGAADRQGARRLPGESGGTQGDLARRVLSRARGKAFRPPLSEDGWRRRPARLGETKARRPLRWPIGQDEGQRRQARLDPPAPAPFTPPGVRTPAPATEKLGPGPLELPDPAVAKRRSYRPPRAERLDDRHQVEQRGIWIAGAGGLPRHPALGGERGVNRLGGGSHRAALHGRKAASTPKLLEVEARPIAPDQAARPRSQTYFTSTTSNSFTPPGVRTSATSPENFPMSALAIGEE